MPEMTVMITQSRRGLLGRLRVFPRAFRRVPSILSSEPSYSDTVFRLNFWSRVRAAWLIAGAQFRIDGSIMEII